MFNKKLLGLTNLTVAVLLFSGCGNTSSNFNTLPQQNVVSTFTVQPTVEFSTSVRTFLSRVNNLGARLSVEQLKEISDQRHVKPNGLFAPRPAMNLSERQNLEVHFKKHYKEFVNINTPEQYLESAIQFHLRNTPTTTYYFDITSFSKGYQSNVVKHDSKTKEFSAMRSDGSITTYYTNNTVSPKRFVPVPEEFYIQIEK